MIKIKSIDKENVLDVCELKTDQDDIRAAIAGRSYCNAISIAESKCHSEIYPNAIYNNNLLIGFFMYQRTENHAKTVMICRFMLDDRFRHDRFEEKALEHILRGLKIQGVKEVMVSIDNANEHIKKLYLSFGFHPTGETDKAGYCYKLEI